MPERYTYVLPHSSDVALEWAIIRVNPDDPELVFAVPLDDGSMVGTPDIDLSDLAGRPMVARCNHGVFLPIQLFTPREGCASELPGEAFYQPSPGGWHCDGIGEALQPSRAQSCGPSTQTTKS